MSNEPDKIQLIAENAFGQPVRLRVDNRGRIISSPSKRSVHNSISADVLLAVPAQSGLRLTGFSVRESAATAATATFRLVDGAVVAAPDVVLPIELGANESETNWFGDGIECDNGITIDIIAGTVDLIIYYKVG